ncbi:PH (Pleckstrin Homology) domain-containing protein [Microbacterium sp. AG1240]|uniref:PH domain-containing protein n=1 Tax=Microbacterium sp. AG1240 TaxID=2183992 RepID=UPI000EAE0C0C|nr:PH domain-containing protein [Microbacterium sp. AG1240]RKT36544.1 PH (Pleckstrin Homology) domain-containing protein [Microbacterium sp. AG1240]
MAETVFRSTFNRVLSYVAWALLAVAIVITLVTPGGLSIAPSVALGCAGGAALIWALLWAPYLGVDDAGVTVVNVFTQYRVPWEALIHVDTQYALTLHTPNRRVRATAAPAPGSLSSLRAARSHRRKGGDATGVRPGDLPGTDSGDAADLVLTRWHDRRDRGLIETGLAEGIAVRPHPRVSAVAAVALGVAALAGAALLV